MPWQWPSICPCFLDFFWNAWDINLKFIKYIWQSERHIGFYFHSHRVILTYLTVKSKSNSFCIHGFMDLDKSFKFVTYTQYDILSLLTYYIDFRLVVPVVSTSVGCTAYWVKIMACCRASSKPLSDTMMIQFTDAYMCHHYNDVITGAMASQITSLTIVYAIVYSDGD